MKGHEVGQEGTSYINERTECVNTYNKSDKETIKLYKKLETAQKNKETLISYEMNKEIKIVDDSRRYRETCVVM